MAVLRGDRTARREMNSQRVGSRQHDDIAGGNTMLAGGTLIDADLTDVAIRLGDAGMDRRARNPGNDMRC